MTDEITVSGRQESILITVASCKHSHADRLPHTDTTLGKSPLPFMAGNKCDLFFELHSGVDDRVTKVHLTLL